jgi:hypothetical protein
MNITWWHRFSARTGPVSQVTGPLATAKGSRPFQAATGDGRALFVKVFGSGQRDACLLYRAWRGTWLRSVGDTRPAARFCGPSGMRRWWR